MKIKFFPIGCKVIANNTEAEGVVQGYLDPIPLGSKLPGFYVQFANGNWGSYTSDQIDNVHGEQIYWLTDECLGD